MKDIHQKFKSLSIPKKILFFNFYAILFAVLFFGISLVFNSLFDHFYEESSYLGSIKSNLNSISFYFMAIAWGYFMAVIALLTRIFNPKPSPKPKE